MFQDPWQLQVAFMHDARPAVDVSTRRGLTVPIMVHPTRVRHRIQLPFAVPHFTNVDTHSSKAACAFTLSSDCAPRLPNAQIVVAMRPPLLQPPR